jgi:hypothetical protein
MISVASSFRLALPLACGLLVACGSGSGGSGQSTGLQSTAVSNTKPQITGNPTPLAVVGVEYEFLPEAADSDGDTLTFHIENRPEWATFSPTTGRFAGTPQANSKSQYVGIEISVTDGTESSALPAFDLSVQGTDPASVANVPPSISGKPESTVVAGNFYEFIPSASDPDSQALLYSVVNLPPWAEFDRISGRLAGTPAPEDIGVFGNVVISVSDGVAEASLPSFDIEVTGGTAPAPQNKPPRISGTPAEAVAAEQSYRFLPSASDPDGQALSFSVINQPAWARFNTSTGLLDGTPSSSDAGTYSNIRISVSDGELSASLPAFSIAVQDVQPGSATLSWTPPTQNEDGSPLTDLKGYRIQYGTKAANLDTVLDIPNPGVSVAVVENLSPATWYFAVKAYNDSNVESSLSNVASKTIN